MFLKKFYHGKFLLLCAHCTIYLMFDEFDFLSLKMLIFLTLIILVYIGKFCLCYNQVSNAHSWTCMDIYVFATPYRVTWDYYFLSRKHTLEFKEWEGKTEYEIMNM